MMMLRYPYGYRSFLCPDTKHQLILYTKSATHVDSVYGTFYYAMQSYS